MPLLSFPDYREPSLVENPNPAAAPPRSAATSFGKWLALVISVAWVLGFLWFCFSLNLPNNQNLPRKLVLEQSDELLAEFLSPKESPGTKVGWRYLPQRFGLIWPAAIVLIGSWGIGSLSLRGLKVREGLMSLERFVFACAVGLAETSLIVLACGLAGMLTRPVHLGWMVLAVLIELIFQFRDRKNSSSENQQASDEPVELSRPGATRLWLWRSRTLIACLPFLFCIVMGGLLPQVDFDVKEYHFGGPKEWYQNGAITFLPHNVYTSFPFLTEMLILAGMVIKQNWYWGAVSGNGVLLCFAPLTALGLYSAGKRWYGETAGLFAAGFYLCTPWVYRISNIAYTEGGLSFYLFASLFAGMLAVEKLRASVGTIDARCNPRNLVVVTGFLAGSAMACKYPGLLSVVIPIGGLILFGTLRGKSPASPPASSLSFPKIDGKSLLLFTVGVTLAIGPWLLKNAVQTGNPVYPLAYRVFGGRDWDEALNAKWNRAHSPDHHHLSDIPNQIIDVAARNDWQNPLLFSFAPLAFLHRLQRGRTWLLWGFLLYLFLTWWIFTHRIDRFWVPLIPVAALLAGIGAAWPASAKSADRSDGDKPLRLVWSSFLYVICGAMGLFLLAFISSPLSGYNAFLSDLDQAAEATARITAPEIVELNQRLPQESPRDKKVLFVGDAEIFDARFPLVYNTVFDQSIFEQWCGKSDAALSSAHRPLKSAEEIRRTFAEQGITHVYVNWLEILRYRTSYRYTDFVTPAKFAELQRMGVLGPAWSTSSAFQLWEDTNPGYRAEVDRWGPTLRVKSPQGDFLKTFEVFPIRN